MIQWGDIKFLLNSRTEEGLEFDGLKCKFTFCDQKSVKIHTNNFEVQHTDEDEEQKLELTTQLTSCSGFNMKEGSYKLIRVTCNSDLMLFKFNQAAVCIYMVMLSLKDCTGKRKSGAGNSSWGT